jgi:nanoRNase/pAp phosphatase (c-di-AMP/oligoRNAs hydrolase)
MVTEVIQQVITKLNQVSNILIVFSGANGDSLSSALALKTFLTKLEKEVTILSSSQLNQKFNFLPGFSDVAFSLNLKKSFVIDVNTSKSAIEELSYKKETDKLSIFIKPRDGQFSAADVNFRTSSFPYEALILIGVPSLEQLGDFYSQNTELFFETPIINIDYRASNENPGEFNLVELSATSISEIILDFINKFESSLIDEIIATQLLSGIIFETNSFQHIRTTPQTFLKASQLVGLGAKQQEIIVNLYKSKSLGLLKLWGRVLAKLKQDPKIFLVHSTVTQSDLEKSQAEEEDITSIIKEMAAQLGFAKNFLFFEERGAELTRVYCHTTLPLNLLGLFSFFNPQIVGHQTVMFEVPKGAQMTEDSVLDIMRLEMSKLEN